MTLPEVAFVTLEWRWYRLVTNYWLLNPFLLKGNLYPFWVRARCYFFFFFFFFFSVQNKSGCFPFFILAPCYDFNKQILVRSRIWDRVWDLFFSILNPCPNIWQVRARFLGQVHILVMNNFGSDPRLADRITSTPKWGILPDKLF